MLHAESPNIGGINHVCSLMYALQGDVLFVRFFEGAASGIDRQGPPIKDSKERLQKNAEALIDIPIIMRTMKVAIQKAVAQNKS